MGLGRARPLVALSFAFILSSVSLVLPASAEQVVGWNPTTSYPLITSGHSCVTSSGYIYCVGGLTFKNFPPDFHDSVYYAQLTASGVGQWSNTTRYPTLIAGASCVAQGGFIYCVGGQTTVHPPTIVDSVYFAPLTASGVGAWSKTTSYPLASWFDSCTVSSGQIYCVAGHTSPSALTNSSGAVSYAEVSGAGVGAWTNTTSFPFPGYAVSCKADAAYLYCTGDKGFAKAPITRSGLGAWSSAGGQLPHGCWTYDIIESGYLYCIGGNDFSRLLASVYYAPVNSTGAADWVRTLGYPIPITSEPCVTSNGFVYCVAGETSNGQRTNSVYFSRIATPIGSVKPTRSWALDHGVRLSLPGLAGFPAGIQLSDGRVRLYFCQLRTNSQVSDILSVISNDGLNFTVEPGVRINATGGNLADSRSVCYPTVVKLGDGTYRMYFNGINSSNLTPFGPGASGMWRVFTAKSSDGLAFTDFTAAIDPGNPGWSSQNGDMQAAAPTARLLPDGRIRIYYLGTGTGPGWPNGGVRSERAVSSDGVRFTWEGALQFQTPQGPQAAAPPLAHSWNLLPDGKTIMFLYSEPNGPFRPNGFYASYSGDGLNFSSQVELFQAPNSFNQTAPGSPTLAHPYLVPLTDGSYRLYFDTVTSAGQQNQDVIYSAHWTPLLPVKTDVEYGATASGNYSVTITHNSTLNVFAFDQNSFTISLSLVGPLGFWGLAKISFPNALLGGSITVTRNGSAIPFQMNRTDTQTSLGLTFGQSDYSIIQILGTTSGSLTKTTASTSSSSVSTSTALSSTRVSSPSSLTAFYLPLAAVGVAVAGSLAIILYRRHKS